MRLFFVVLVALVLSLSARASEIVLENKDLLEVVDVTTTTEDKETIVTLTLQKGDDALEVYADPEEVDGVLAVAEGDFVKCSLQFIDGELWAEAVDIYDKDGQLLVTNAKENVVIRKIVRRPTYIIIYTNVPGTVYYCDMWYWPYFSAYVRVGHRARFWFYTSNGYRWMRYARCYDPFGRLIVYRQYRWYPEYVMRIRIINGFYLVYTNHRTYYVNPFQCPWVRRLQRRQYVRFRGRFFRGRYWAKRVRYVRKHKRRLKRARRVIKKRKDRRKKAAKRKKDEAKKRGKKHGNKAKRPSRGKKKGAKRPGRGKKNPHAGKQKRPKRPGKAKRPSRGKKKGAKRPGRGKKNPHAGKQKRPKRPGKAKRPSRGKKKGAKRPGRGRKKANNRRAKKRGKRAEYEENRW